jgi:cation diffusion facilitator family transporter
MPGAGVAIWTPRRAAIGRRVGGKGRFGSMMLPAMDPQALRDRSRRRAAWLSFVVGFAMLGIKMGAYVATGSTTVLSDALESVVHVAATSFMFFCFHLAALPADANHPYGHGKAEHLSIGFEGGMIMLAALAIVWESVRHLISGGSVPHEIDIGFWLIGSAAAINLLLGAYLLRVGKRTGSALLAADGHHVLSDVWTSVGVLCGIGLMWFVEDEHRRTIIDSTVAIGLAVFIAMVATKLIRRAVGGLLDEVDKRMLGRVVEAINEIREPDWLDVHNLRMRASGDITHIDFHLTVPGDWTIARGHQSEERLEQHILERLGSRGSVLIHFDYPSDAEHQPPREPDGTISPLTLASATRWKPN